MKKSKDTPTATESLPAVAMPVKPATQMKKRGEEEADSKYLSMQSHATCFEDYDEFCFFR